LFIFVLNNKKENCGRRGANAMADNNTPYFGMTAKVSRPKRRKVDNGRECPEGVKTGIGTYHGVWWPPKSRLPPVHHIFIPPFCLFLYYLFIFRGGANAKVDNNTPYFGMTAKFSRPKRRKIGNGRECLKAPPEV
jgi:hypothetical protein